VALALAAIAALLVGYAVSAARDYSKVYKAAFGVGYHDEYEASTRWIDSLAAPWREGRQVARNLLEWLTLDRVGVLKHEYGYCILTVKVDNDSMQGTSYPGCVGLVDCVETKPTEEYILKPDGVWSRPRY